MKRGEHAAITVAAEHAYGAAGATLPLGAVPAGAKLVYEVALSELAKAKEKWDMSAAEKISAAEARKNAGNELFKAGRLERACKKYERGQEFVDYDHGFSDDEKKQAKAVKLALYSNQVAVKLKQADHAAAAKLATKALELDASSVKLLFRRAQANVALDFWDEAEADLKRAEELEPDNKDVKAEMARLKRKVTAPLSLWHAFRDHTRRARPLMIEGVLRGCARGWLIRRRYGALFHDEP